MNLQRGEIVLADYAHANVGASFRPVLIVQSDDYNRRIANTVVAQITSTLKRTGDRAHCLIDISTADGAMSGLLRTSIVSCNNLNTLDQQRIKRVKGRLPESLMWQVDECLKAALGIT